MFTIEYNTTRYLFTSPLNSSLPTSNYSEIFLRRFNEMKKKSNRFMMVMEVRTLEICLFGTC